MGGVGALSVSTTAYGFSAPVLRLRVARYHISPPQWPAGLKLRIAAIADLHACDPWMSLDHVQAIVERTNALKPDIVVLLGGVRTSDELKARLDALVAAESLVRSC